MSSLKKATQQGFTIVELLIVIVVIGILAALVITTYSGIQQRGRNTERTTDLKAVQGQLEAYYTNNGAYPAASEFGTNGTTNVSFIQAKMRGLDKEALRDPQGAADNYALTVGDTPVAKRYAYNPTAEGGGACTAEAADCAKYRLSAVPEGGEPNIVLNSLN